MSYMSMYLTKQNLMMKNRFKYLIKNALCLSALAVVLFSTACKYNDLVEGTYPDQLVYLPAAVGGVYNVSTVVASGAARYAVDLGAKKLNIPLGVFRSGTTSSGEATASLAANTDTLTKLIASGAASMTGVEILPAANYTLPASATIASGADIVPFNLAFDLDYLRNNATKKFAVGITITDGTPSVNQALKTAIVVIDAKILKPAASFTTTIAARKVTFANTSTFGVSYNWNFGDGSANSTTAAPIYTYTNAGTYTVTLTTTGITGTLDATTKTMTVTVL